MNSFSSSVIIGISLAVVGVGALVVPVPESGFTQAAQVNGQQIRTGVNAVGRGFSNIGRGITNIGRGAVGFVSNRAGAVTSSIRNSFSGNTGSTGGPSGGSPSGSGIPRTSVGNQDPSLPVTPFTPSPMGGPVAPRVGEATPPTTPPPATTPAATPTTGGGPVLPQGRTTPLGTEQQQGSLLELMQYMGIQQRQVPIER